MPNMFFSGKGQMKPMCTQTHSGCREQLFRFFSVFDLLLFSLKQSARLTCPVSLFLIFSFSPFKTISEAPLPWRMETHSPQTGQVLTMLTGRTAAQSLWNLFSKHSPSARLNEEDRREYLPRIPVQPVGFRWNWKCLFSQQVGYTDAEQLLMRMEGEPAPEDWQGGLDMVYKWVENCICRVFDEARLGGELTDELSGGRVTIEVNNRQEEKVSSNVIGVLLGSDEPDRCRS